MKIGRNQPCPCGSGQKFKRCHGDPRREDRIAGDRIAAMEMAFARHRAAEVIRKQQQGEGRPIISTEIDGHRMVAVGNEIRFSKRWKVFSDFLNDYMKTVIGSDWGNAEIAKPFEKRHPIMQWYDGYCRFQKNFTKKVGGLYSGTATGVAYCYFGLAYSLYLLKHNVELQDRLLRRLRDPKQFQGAYYELIVANVLIRAGFDLELEDEVNDETKHCEFSAVSHATGAKYWVEAKMRSVAGLLAKTDADGSRSKDPTDRLSEHVRLAFQKPAADKRLIFVDLNAPGEPENAVPSWVERAARRLEDRERGTPDEQTAYVFVTNICFHRHLDDEKCGGTGMAYGLKMADFGKPGRIRLSDKYRAKQKHADAHRIAEAIQSYPQIPVTFDGSMPSDAVDGGSPRILIGERYFFEGIEGGVVGTVTTATVSEAEKKAYIGVTTQDGRSLILSESMTDQQLREYAEHKDAYFGVIQRASRNCKDAYELFEFLLETYSKSSKEKLLEFVRSAPDLAKLEELSQEDLAIEICERWAGSMGACEARNNESTVPPPIG